MSDARRAHLEPEETLGEGNCALNAFALGLSDADLLQHLNLFLQHAAIDPNGADAFADFIKAVAGIWEIDANWESVSAALVRVRSDKIRLQQSLAPILRNLAVAEMKKDSQCINKTIQPIQSAVRTAVRQQAGIPVINVSPDDVYVKLNIVKEKIKEYSSAFQTALAETPFLPMLQHFLDSAELKPAEKEILRNLLGDEQFFPLRRYISLITSTNLNSLDTKILSCLENIIDAIYAPFAQALETWWRGDDTSSGYLQFLEIIKQNGEWLGDLELSYLAAYFRLNLHIKTSCWYTPHENTLFMPRELLMEETIRQLVVHGVINHPQPEEQQLVFLSFDSLAELQQRLGALPEAIQFFILNPMLKEMQVPSILSKFVEQMERRNICQAGVFVVDVQTAIDRSLEVDEYIKVIDYWREHHYPAPSMYLNHVNNNHYENMRSSSPISIVIPVPPKKISGPVAVGVFLVWYVTALWKLSSLQRDTPEKIFPLSGNLRMLFYSPLKVGYLPSIAATPLGLFNRKQRVSEEEYAWMDAQRPLLPTAIDPASLVGALQGLPCTIL